jgi:hypothetical protein
VSKNKQIPHGTSLALPPFFKEGNMANLCRRIHAFFPVFILIALLSGCGGGGGTAEEGISGVGGPEPFPAKILTWSPPSRYADGTPLNPLTDLDGFEIYINEDGLFSDMDNEMAALSTIDPATGNVNTSFDLANLSNFLSEGVTYHVSVRAVARTGMKSGFSPSAAFSF